MSVPPVWGCPWDNAQGSHSSVDTDSLRVAAKLSTNIDTNAVTNESQIGN